jgi:crotonobetainyl-CoA:carnitine CoA-transferase CaiB-like acyl-CoA transferase
MISSGRQDDVEGGGALAGVIVLELGMVMQVPLAGQMLGDLGADVIKVERLPPGEILRTLDPAARETGAMSAYYAALCRNKRSLSLDIKAPDGRAALLRLIDQADVLIHNFRPGVMERLGLGWEELEERNPRLVYAAGFAFGPTGPMAHMPGQDMLAQAYSGLARSGLADDEVPRLSNAPVIDYVTAATLTQGILAALLERSRSGRGQKVTTSLLDTAMAVQVLEAATMGIRSERTSWTKHAMILPTRDGWIIVLTLFRPNPLSSLCDAFGLPDLSREAPFATYDDQVANLSIIKERFAPLFAERTTAECIERLSAQDILCAPVNTLEQALEAPQVRENGSIWEIPVPGVGPRLLMGNPLHLSRTPAHLEVPPAELGAHGPAVLASFAFGTEEIAALRRSGVLHVPHDDND